MGEPFCLARETFFLKKKDFSRALFKENFINNYFYTRKQAG